MRETQVLIIGAGPTGLMLALELALQGTPFVIIDRASASTQFCESRGIVLHARSLELISRHDLIEEFFQKGCAVTGSRMYVHKNLVLDLSFEDTSAVYEDSEFRMPLMISQAETETIFEKKLESAYGLNVERGVSAETLEHDAEGVTVVLSTGEKIRSRYAVGCDGAHSIVRKWARLEFEGGMYQQDFILADVQLKWDQPIYMSFCFGSAGFLSCIPMRDGRFRLITTRLSEWGKDTEPQLEDFRQAIKALAPGPWEILDVFWLARFRLHHRIVNNYRCGRLFLAGDAAHVHSPMGGQGLNAGIQDAVNLGWKLAAVLRGEQNDDFLNSYHEERHRVGTHLLNGTDRAFEFVAWRNPLWICVRNTLASWIAPWLMKDRQRRAKRLRFVTQLAIRYRHSSIVGCASLWTGPLRGGDRAPDGILRGISKETSLHSLIREPGHSLLLFSGIEPNMDLEKMATVFSDFPATVYKISSQKGIDDDAWVDLDGSLRKLYGFSKPGYVLVRPDGYISFIGGVESCDELRTRGLMNI
ncbi:Nn.00g090330.m01.CDS01 [Neocucurbitaria sp. VM-36]